MMRQIFTLFTLFAIFVSHSDSAFSQEAERDWTFMVYLIGADLESGSNAGSTDIAEMLAAGSTEYVNVIVLTGGADKDGWRTPKTWKIENGVQTELSFVPSNKTNMADPGNLTEFINWSTQNYPAQSYMLDFWNHGSDIRGYGNDEISKKNFTIPKIKQAIANTDFIKSDKKFDVIGFDACLMGSLEVQSSLKDFAYYYVASEEQEPGHGWNYTPIVKAMNDGNYLNGDEIGRVIVDGFKNQGISEGTNAVTLAVTDLYYISDLESALSTLFDKIKSESLIKKLQRARGKAEEYSKSIQDPEYSEDMVDIGDLMKKLKKLAPSLTTEINTVLSLISDAVIYSTTDAARPLATGISMYFPHNVLVDEGETEWMLSEVYNTIDFSAGIKNFVKDDYVAAVTSDKRPPTGTIGESIGRQRANVSAITVEHDDDLEQVQVVLVEEFVGYPDEYILLGASYPDSIIINDDDTETYIYDWDGHWLGINGFPAYVSDIHDFEVVDSSGNIEYITRIHIPAILNPDTDEEQNIIIAYAYDQDFNITLENIMPETYMTSDDDSTRIIPKQRLFLEAGDKVQLLYESFNEVTDEEFFVVDDRAIFTIENGNDDLKLEYDQLEEGDYHVGFLLMDHSQNDTLIFDDAVYSVVIEGIASSFQANNISMYPNPAANQVTIQNDSYAGKSYAVKIFDQVGRLHFEAEFTQPKISINTKNLSEGIYMIEIQEGNKISSDALIIKH